MKNSKFSRMIKKVNLYPPYLGAGIRVSKFNDDLTRFEVQLRDRWYNRNLVGSHFGGSLYAMSDPFYMFIVIANLGTDYIVWDKSASIDFLRPAKGTITGVFEISRVRLDEIKAEVDHLGKSTFNFDMNLLDEEGERVARVSKEIYVRSKLAKKREQ